MKIAAAAKHLARIPCDRRLPVCRKHERQRARARVTARIGWFCTSYDSPRRDTHTLESLAGARAYRHAQADADSRADCAPTCEQRRMPEKPPELFAFTRLYGDLVAYNAMLRGRLINRSSPHTAGAPPLIAERLFRLAGAFGEFSMSRSVVGRAQWDTHGVRYGQHFGRVALEFSTRF